MFKTSRTYLAFSIICIVLFAINLVIGKLEVAYKINSHVHLEGVPEFILLLAAVIFFIISTLLKEQSQFHNKTKEPEEVKL